MPRATHQLSGLLAAVTVLAPVDAQAGPIVAWQQDSPTAYDTAFDALIDLEPIGQGAQVTNLVLERDVARFTLVSGTIHPLTPVLGRTIGVVFIGQGRFQFTPPEGVERNQLRLHLEVDSLDVAFDRLVLLFADSTMHELEAQLEFAAGKPHKDAGKHVEYTLKYLSDKKHRWFHVDLMTALLNEADNRYFYANVRHRGDDPFLLEITPYEAEGIRLARKSKARRAGETPEVICQFPLQADRGLDEDARDLVHVTRYAVDVLIEDNLDFHASVELQMSAVASDLRWVPFHMFSDFEVDSASWADGSPVTFFWKKENPWLWIRFDPELSEGDRRTLKIHYGGDLIIYQNYWHYLRTSIGWYPQHGTRRLAEFDMAFTFPEDLRLAAVGTMQSSDTTDDMVTSRWVTDRPIRNAGFNLGEFEPFEIDYPGVPRTTVLMAKEAHRNLRTRFLSGDKMEADVASDVVSSVSFFMQVFGTPLDTRFYATEIPYGHGEAFPGMVHLSWATFHEDRNEGVDETFRAHEMAHQWWPIAVDYKSYRDRWLSEGMAEFSALLYLDLALYERKKYEEQLKDWRDEIMDRSDKAGPVALGHRVAASDHPEDYSTFVYRKGAWIAHMIRSMMADLQTGSDERFLAMIQDFYRQYRGKRASTDDFRAVVEKHIGMNMKWFFDQWFEETAIPTYEFSYDVQETDSEQFIVSLRIDQRGVPNGFQMVVPIEFDFEDGQSVRYQLIVKGPGIEVDVPALPLRPKRIVLNPGEAVLAKVKNVRWQR